MVNMTYQTTSESLPVREKLTQLMNKRSDLESELKAYLDILSAVSIFSDTSVKLTN
jgi:hypothetical protein